MSQTYTDTLARELEQHLRTLYSDGMSFAELVEAALSDLRHLADRGGVDFGAADKRAREEYLSEVGRHGIARRVDDAPTVRPLDAAAARFLRNCPTPRRNESGLARREHAAATLTCDGASYIMEGPSGRHVLAVEGTDLDRLNAHWITFAAHPRNQ